MYAILCYPRECYIGAHLFISESAHSCWIVIFGVRSEVDTIAIHGHIRPTNYCLGLAFSYPPANCLSRVNGEIVHVGGMSSVVSPEPETSAHCMTTVTDDQSQATGPWRVCSRGCPITREMCCPLIFPLNLSEGLVLVQYTACKSGLSVRK
jgi:hypothetical protein